MYVRAAYMIIVCIANTRRGSLTWYLMKKKKKNDFKGTDGILSNLTVNTKDCGLLSVSSSFSLNSNNQILCLREQF